MQNAFLASSSSQYKCVYLDSSGLSLLGADRHGISVCFQEHMLPLFVVLFCISCEWLEKELVYIPLWYRLLWCLSESFALVPFVVSLWRFRVQNICAKHADSGIWMTFSTSHSFYRKTSSYYMRWGISSDIIKLVPKITATWISSHVLFPFHWPIVSFMGFPS